MTKAKGYTGFHQLTKGRLTKTIGYVLWDIKRPYGIVSERDQKVVELLREARKLMDVPEQQEEMHTYLRNYWLDYYSRRCLHCNRVGESCQTCETHKSIEGVLA